VLTWKAAGASIRAFGPNTTPAGLRKYRSAWPTLELKVPSIREASPPVTRLITFLIVSGPVKVAVWPVAMPNFSKLWKRLSPRRLPNAAPISIWPPRKLTLGPRLPSVTIWDWAGSGATSTMGIRPRMTMCDRNASCIGYPRKRRIEKLRAGNLAIHPPDGESAADHVPKV
jgi:hypothetical protein